MRDAAEIGSLLHHCAADSVRTARQLAVPQRRDQVEAGEVADGGRVGRAGRQPQEEARDDLRRDGEDAREGDALRGDARDKGAQHASLWSASVAPGGEENKERRGSRFRTWK